MIEALQCRYPHIYVMIHGDTAVREGVLAAYVHWFNTEARRCNFTNDAATIQIFIKGLKNAHSLATCIYEKGPHILNDAISEVKKLKAVQQLTATINPPSMVNMSNDEDHCFQYQEHGHIARNGSSIMCHATNY